MGRSFTRILSAVALSTAAGGAILIGGTAPASAAVTGTVGTVDSGSTPLNIRSTASTSAATVGSLRSGSTLTLVCQVTGQWISGRVRATNLWDKLPDGRYVSDAYVRRGTVSPCDATPPPPPPPATDGTTQALGTVDSGNTPLNVRSGPTTASSVVTQLRTGAVVSLQCQVTGQWISGRVRATNLWDKLADGRYVSDAYLRRGASLPDCSSPNTPSLPPQAAPGTATGWTIPVPGSPVQTFRPATNPTHDGVDIMQPRDTPIAAASAGRVSTVECNTSGSSCDVDGSPSVRGCGWYIEIQHAGDVITRYCHLVRQPSVAVGQQVQAGQTIGYVGTSGNSGGTHLHFEVHIGPGPATPANAVDPIEFMQRMNAPLDVPTTTRR
ncbi:peptidoglycan DD-metalloendopeptidase family protein [Planosporangium sp. 12N6]|uniref:peptidoglycan DD-metalloendopeptidase family protein n=1 Tax=Planosporangium spinosum TaxID=3402278 RepID=UPI003CE6716C